MVKTIISVDPKKAPWEQATPLHNRWHPDIPPIATVEENEIFRVECVDWTGGQIKNNDSSDDIKNVDLSQVHYLSGPIQIPTAKPGDLLKVEFLNLGTATRCSSTHARVCAIVALQQIRSKLRRGPMLPSTPATCDETMVFAMIAAVQVSP